MDVRHDRRHSLAALQDGGTASVGWSARTQPLLEASYALCVEALHEPLQRCLGEFAQQLFAMAEKAHRPAEQQDCLLSRQRVLQDQAAFGYRFVERVGQAIVQLDAAPVPGPAAAKPWRALELLDTVEHELALALEQLGARGEARHSNVLYELSYRVAVLVTAPPLEGRALPIGPYALAQACLQTSLGLGLPLAHQLLLLQQFDQQVIGSLAPLYASVNAHLLTHGILPRLRSIPAVPRNAGQRAVRSSDAATIADAPLVAAQRSPATGAGTGDSIEVLESLRDLLARKRDDQARSTNQPAGRAASEDELQAALGALQQHLTQVTQQASRELRTAARLREELLAQLNRGSPGDAPRTRLSGEQGDRIDLVAGLFEQLEQRMQRSTNAQAVLGDLQLPVLRMAVADPDFFEQPSHPARRLLDTVTAAANDWFDESDEEGNRPLAAKLAQLASHANQQPPSVGLYATLLADIEQHLALLTRKAQIAERRHVEAAQGRERLNLARQRAGELIAERFAPSPPRGLLRTLLERAWSDVLALMLLRHGEQSEAFAAHLQITDQLLGRLPQGDRTTLQQNVESGLRQIGMHAEEAVQVAQRLLGVAPPDPAAELPSATDLALRLKQHQRLGAQRSDQPAEPAPVATAAPPTAPRAREPSPRERRIEQHLRQLPFETWFEFRDGDGQTTRRKLAWYSSMSGRCLLVNRRGQRGEEMTLVHLAGEIANGRVREVPAQRESLFERAWRSLGGGLRLAVGGPIPSTPESMHP